MKIVFASDHAGFELKNHIVAFVRDTLGYEVFDHGAAVFDAGDDYPDFISHAAKAVSEDPTGTMGIIFGGSGQGEAIVANRYRGVRAVVFYGEPSGSDLSIIRLSREHNDANILSIGARFVSVHAAEEAVRTWLTTSFTHEVRNERRINKINELKG